MASGGQMCGNWFSPYMKCNWFVSVMKCCCNMIIAILHFEKHVSINQEYVSEGNIFGVYVMLGDIA